jgi:hypothetical protein
MVMAAKTDPSQGTALISGRETSSMASISIDSHSFSPVAGSHR